MKRGKSRKRFGLHILSVLALMLAFCLPVSAGVKEGDGEYEIYPTPQSVTYGAGSAALTDKVNVKLGDDIDTYTQTRIEDTLKVLGLEKAASGAGNTDLIVGVYGSGDEADVYGQSHNVDSSIYEKFDAYTLWVQDGDIVILGKNTDAAYYGVTTLKRIFEQIADQGGKSIRELTLKDYADVEFRGFIEGYYGNPWSHEDRLDLMKFGGEIKMNQYIYAPKDDPLHNRRWRDLYDEEGLKNIAELAKAGNESKCFFVYALHTFMNNPINFSSDATYQADLQVIKNKLGQVIEAGVRQVAILEDDAAGTSAANIIKLMNDLNAWLKELKAAQYPDLKTDILYCPTCYMATTDSKMTAISEGVSREIHIVVTGGKIWGEVSSAFADAFYNGLNANGNGRYPYMWVNWPCNDNTKNSQIMGGHNYILHTGVDGSKYEGIVLNPIQESEPSKVGIFTAADFCWQTWDDPAEGDQAWDDAFKYIDHMTPIESEESNALREAAKHMITQAPSQTTGKQVQFDESVEIKDQITEFTSKMNAGTITAGDVDSLRAEFVKINDATKLYLEKGTNKRAVKQLTPFLSNLRDMTQADINLLDAMKAGFSKDTSGVWENFAAAQAAYEQSGTYGFEYYNAGILYATSGRKYIKPFTDAALEYVSEEVKQIVAPDDVIADKYEATFSRTPGWGVYEGQETNMTDGNDSTTVWYRTENNSSAAGDYIQLDLGSVKPVGTVRALVGADGGDKWTKYHVEYSVDGTTWERLSSYTGSGSGVDKYEVSLEGASARYIKLVNDVQVDKWVKFSEFSVYEYVGDANKVYTNTANAGWEAEYGDDTFRLLAKENAVLQPGEYVGMKLDRIHDVKSITVSGAGTESLTLEKSMNPDEWTTEKTGGARYIRLINKGSQAVNFSLTSFVVETNEIFPTDLLETSLGGATNEEDPRRLGTTKYWMDGDLSTRAKYCASPQAGSYITYDIGQEIDLRSVRVYALDTEIDYPRDAKIQASLDNEHWEDLITIGDGVANTAEDKDTKPVESPDGGWIHDTVNVAYAYVENTNIQNMKARYIRVYFTAPYSSRWVALNEILINDGEYFPSIIDPTFETNAAEQRGFEIQNLTDGNLTTAFKPDGTENGSLVYNLSDGKAISRINIVQSGSSISNAKVSVRTGAETWKELGNLDQSFSAFYTGDLEKVYAVRLEWEDVVPVLYEIITLENAGDVFEKNLNDAQRELDAAAAEVEKAQAAVTTVDAKIKDAEAKVNAAANAADKLRAEIELQKLYAEKAEAEAPLYEKKAAEAAKAAKVARVEARNLSVEGNETQAAAKEQDALKRDAEVTEFTNTASARKTDAENYRQKALDKQAELDKLLKGGGQSSIEEPNDPVLPSVTGFNYKNVKYKVVNASAKTVAAVGVVTKKVKSVTVYNTIKYSGTTWKVVEIKAKAFKGCKKLAKVTIGNNVKKIGKEAFAQCKNLKTVNLKKASKITSIGKKAFAKINAKAKITVPAKKLAKYKKMLKKAGVPKTVKIKK